MSESLKDISVPDDGEAAVADTAFSKPSREIAVNVSGVLRIQLAGGSNPILDIYIAAGAPFGVNAIKVLTTGSDAATLAGGVNVLY